MSERENFLCPTYCDLRQNSYPTETSEKRSNDKNYIIVNDIVDSGTCLHRSPAGYAEVVKVDTDNPETEVSITSVEQTECHETPVDQSGYSQLTGEEEKLLSGKEKIEKN